VITAHCRYHGHWYSLNPNAPKPTMIPAAISKWQRRCFTVLLAVVIWADKAAGRQPDPVQIIPTAQHCLWFEQAALIPLIPAIRPIPSKITVAMPITVPPTSDIGVNALYTHLYAHCLLPSAIMN
jgi:hypothetical protein